MPDEFIESKIQELVKQKDWRRLKEILSGWPAPDIADLFENIRVEEVVILLDATGLLIYFSIAKWWLRF